MVNDWVEYKIDDLKAPVKGSIAMGPFGSRIKAENFVTAGIPIIKGSQLHGAYVLDSDFDFLTPEKAEELKGSQAYRGDLVITHRGTIGQVSIIPHDSLYEKYIVSQSQLKVSLDTKKVNPYFVNYFFRTHLGQHRLLANASQVGVPAISKASTSVKGIMVPCPKLEEQNRIVAYLKTLDDKIELNRDMNKTLEVMAQALFKSWFIDFDPVIDNALEAGNSIPDELSDRAEQRKTIKQNDNNRAISSLFPDEFEFSEKVGWIPKGWEVNEVGTVLNRLKTKVKYKKADVSAYGKVPVYEQGMDVLLGFHNNIPDIEASIDNPAFIFGDHTCVTKLSLESFSISANVIPLRGKKYPTLWVYYAVRDKQSFEEYRRHWMELIVKPVIIPSLELTELFSTHIVSFGAKQMEIQHQNSCLVKLRDTLLPKLMSGEIRIPEAAALVEDI